MAICNTITIKDLEFYNRIDAELYNPSLKKSFELLYKCGYEIYRLKDFCIIRSGVTPKDRDDSLNEGPVLFKTTDIRNNILNPYNNYYHISSTIFKRMSYTKLTRNDVLLNIVGATLDVIGRSAYTSEFFQEANITQAMALIRVKNGIRDFLNGYVFCFLNTKYAQDQIKRYARPTGQFNLNLSETGYISIPKLPIAVQKDIESSIKYSAELLAESSKRYLQAQSVFEKELGIDKYEFRKALHHQTTYYDAFNFNRFDAEYSQPKYAELKNIISTYKKGFEPFLKNVSSIPPNINPKVRPNEIFNYIEFSNIKSSLGLVEDSMNTTGREVPSRAQRLVEKGDVIASSVVGSVDKSALISEMQSGYLASTGFFQFRSIYYSPEYLLILIQSKLITDQLKQEATGGILSAVSNDSLKYLIIPTIPKESQDEITELVKKSHQQYKMSKQLLRDAIKKVENLIEADGKPN